MDQKVLEKVSTLMEKCVEYKLMVATAESCTGGLLAALITEVPGVSAIFDRGFITYSDESKHDLLDVDMKLIKKHGAVSSEVAVKMAEGAVARSRAAAAVSITGIAGPSGYSENKPVGLVYIGTAVKGKESSYKKYNFSGGRHEIRAQAVEMAMDFLLRRVEDCTYD